MFGKKRLLDEAQLAEYAAKLQAKNDDEIINEVRNQVYNAGFFPVHSRHDQKATQCWKETERRQKPWLYQRGYNGALRDAGQEVTAFDLERASESHYTKEAA